MPPKETRGCRSGAFLVEFERLLVGLFGELQPDKESGQHDERNDDEGAECHSECHGDGLESLHGLPPLVFAMLRSGYPLAGLAPGAGVGVRRLGPPVTSASMSSRVNSARPWRLP